MKLLRRTNIVTALLFLLSGSILGWTIYSNFTIDVLDDKTWRLILPTGDIHAGQTILVKSEYRKLRTVEGQAQRYIECWTRENIQVSYLVSTAVADRAKGTGGTGLPIPIPANIPGLPIKCDIRVVIKYHVLPLRDVIEVKTSQNFTLLSANVSGASSGAKGTSPIPSPPVSQSQNSSASLLYHAPLAVRPQLNIPQGSNKPSTSASNLQPSLVEQQQNTVKGIPLAGHLFY